MIDSALELNCVLTDFLSVGSAYFWSKVVGVSNDDSGFNYFSLYFYQILLHIVWCSVVRYIHLKNCYVFFENLPLETIIILSSYNALISNYLFYVILSLSEININTPAFFWSMLGYYIFLHPFTFNLGVSLYLMWASCRQHDLGSSFLIPSDNLCILSGLLRPLMFKVINIIGLISIIFITIFYLQPLFVSFFVFHYFAFCDFNCAFYMIMFSFFLRISYTSFFILLFLVSALEFAVYIYNSSKSTFKWQYIHHFTVVSVSSLY